jgi:putative RecB family exonuclease
MTTYSHSRISTYENCPYKYKLQYIDHIKPDIQNTIEAFMGSIVHETLEKLYKDKKFEQIDSKETLFSYYNYLWNKEYSEDILIAKANQGLTSDNYKKMGEKFISDYYDRMKPFNQLTIIDLETQDRMNLPDGNQWHVRIDKFACDDEGNYYVCDYKTNSRMKDQEEANSDRQLAMYSIWVKDKFKDAKRVLLVWHMLAFNKDVISERTEEELRKLQEEIVIKIAKIENAKNFPTNVSPLCNYCGYQSICPSFKHKLELKNQSTDEFKKDDGLKFVNEYSEVKNKIKDLKNKEEELKEKLIKFALHENANIIYGSDTKCSVTENDKIVLPEDKTELIKFLKNKNILEKYSTLNYMKLNSEILKGNLDFFKNNIEIKKEYSLNLSKRNDGENE